MTDEALAYLRKHAADHPGEGMLLTDSDVQDIIRALEASTAKPVHEADCELGEHDYENQHPAGKCTCSSPEPGALHPDTARLNHLDWLNQKLNEHTGSNYGWSWT